MNMTKKEYAQYVKSKAPSSRLARDTALAWLSGGAICVLGQGLIDWYKALGLPVETASATASMTLVAAAAVLTAFRAYDSVAKWAGAGTLVPITGFSNSMVAPAMEFKSEGLVAGMAAKMFVIAGPVLVYGVLASMLYGAVLWVMKLVKGG
ncbi:MAG: SpoVA/SpoVAEb family sporulation membrane protein [Oscillospiraceae bacterium]|nr:SpoVA/SpoVAEb family sporulation membrane protein [Oscillospiraceae bacterium]